VAAHGVSRVNPPSSLGTVGAMAGNQHVAKSSGQSPKELTERAVVAISREWGITEDEARAAIARCRKREDRLTPQVARAQVWRAPLFDLTDPATRAAYYKRETA
jgi:hypothetical protein